MSRFTPYLVSALAVATPFVHCIAVPATPLQAVPDKFLQVRDPIAFAAPVQIGDLLSFHNGQLLRRANETAPSEVFARESFSDSLDKRAVIVKRNDPVWPQPMPIKDEWEEEGIIDCGDIGKICIGEAGIKLGKGSAGDVFKAIDEKNKIIAVKLFDVEKARDLEYDNSKKVDDDANIVDILAKCKKFGSKFPIAMELVEGESLQKRIDSKVYAKLESEAPVKLIMKQVFGAIGHAHSKGVAHNDIKGDNIIVGTAEKATVIDFGESTTEKTVKTIDVAGGIRGPEAEDGKQDIDTQANDTWELGVLLVSLLIGKKPWTNANAANAKAIWIKDAPTQRKEACKKEWSEFSDDFCDVLADIFVGQNSRKPVDSLGTRIANSNLKFFDECEKKKKTPSKRAAAEGEMHVTSVEDTGDELVVRAMMY